MTNPNLLKAKMVEGGFTQEKLSKILGLSQSALNNKLTGKVEFKESEIAKMMSILNLSKDNLIEIFFAM